jgi:hypothetical protein
LLAKSNGFVQELRQKIYMRLFLTGYVEMSKEKAPASCRKITYFCGFSI